MKPDLEKEVGGPQKIVNVGLILSLLLHMLFTRYLLDYLNVKNV